MLWLEEQGCVENLNANAVFAVFVAVIMREMHFAAAIIVIVLSLVGP